MSPQSTRRRFLKELSAGAAAVVGLGACGRASLAVRQEPWDSVPQLDGALLLDEGTRAQMATDFGANVHRMPAAVLRPRSAQDVVRIVRLANARPSHVVMRGQGHSQYGQTLVEGGVVIDSTTLNAVTVESGGTVYAQAGASWDDVTHATLPHGLTPPALGDTMSLSVGGILSAGGIGNSSHLYGAVIDNVLGLDVITGTGDIVACSPDQNRELFELALGGMGQCALIIGARLRLLPAPKWVVRRDLFYDDLKTFLADVRRVATEARVEHLGAHVLPPDAHSGWKFRIDVGKFSAEPDVDFAPIEAGLRFASRGAPVGVTYASYLHREDARNAALAATRRDASRRLLYLTMFVPDTGAEAFLAQMLDTPADTAGISRFSLYVLPTRKFGRPMFMIPREELALGIFLFRGVSVADAGRYAEMVATVRGLALRTREAGGTAYPPYAPFYSSADWKAHYGSTWQGLANGKRRYDPRNVLTPGTRMFASTGGP